jgi:predicted ArsR family transcriptional regulator
MNAQADDPLKAVTALAEPNRRALYEHIAADGGWVSRDAAADAVGLERGTAAHHLDRLAADGLLEVEFRRLSGRQGPGAGRPAKLYRRARREFDVALPPRDYVWAGRLLAEAMDRLRNGDAEVDTALDGVAREEGLRLAGEIDTQMPPKARRTRTGRRAALLDALATHGFEPHATEGDVVVLRNCPFHQLAREHTELICHMNLNVIQAVIDGVGDTGLEARLDPEEGQCCVKLLSVAGGAR